MRLAEQRHVTPAGRSVLYDLGFDKAEARVLGIRADLMAALREHIEKQGLDTEPGGRESGYLTTVSVGADEGRVAGL